MNANKPHAALAWARSPGLIFLWIGVGVVGLWALICGLLMTALDDAALQGGLGSLFGAVSILFAALALVGLGYLIVIEGRQLTSLRTSIDEATRTQEQLRNTLESIEQARQSFHETSETHRRQRQDQADARFADHLLRAIQFELEAILACQDRGIGKDLASLEDGQCLRSRFSMAKHFDTVFVSNAVHLGRLDGSLSRLIITSYAWLRSLGEAYRLNDIYSAELDDIELNLKRYSTDPFLLNKRADLETRMIRHARLLKQMDGNLREEIRELFKAIDAARLAKASPAPAGGQG